jgi:hypothetical protein
VHVLVRDGVALLGHDPPRARAGRVERERENDAETHGESGGQRAEVVHEPADPEVVAPTREAGLLPAALGLGGEQDPADDDPGRDERKEEDARAHDREAPLRPPADEL